MKNLNFQIDTLLAKLTGAVWPTKEKPKKRRTFNLGKMRFTWEPWGGGLSWCLWWVCYGEYEKGFYFDLPLLGHLSMTMDTKRGGPNALWLRELYKDDYSMSWVRGWISKEHFSVSLYDRDHWEGSKSIRCGINTTWERILKGKPNYRGPQGQATLLESVYREVIDWCHPSGKPTPVEVEFFIEVQPYLTTYSRWWALKWFRAEVSTDVALHTSGKGEMGYDCGDETHGGGGLASEDKLSIGLGPHFPRPNEVVDKWIEYYENTAERRGDKPRGTRES